MNPTSCSHPTRLERLTRLVLAFLVVLTGTVTVPSASSADGNCGCGPKATGEIQLNIYELPVCVAPVQVKAGSYTCDLEPDLRYATLLGGTFKFEAQGASNSFKVSFKSKVEDPTQNPQPIAISNDNWVGVTVNFPGCARSVSIGGKTLSLDDPSKLSVTLDDQKGFKYTGYVSPGADGVSVSIYGEGTPDMDLKDLGFEFEISAQTSQENNNNPSPEFGSGGTPSTPTPSSPSAATYSSSLSMGPSASGAATENVSFQPATVATAASLESVSLPSQNAEVTKTNPTSTQKQAYKAGSGLVDVTTPTATQLVVKIYETAASLTQNGQGAYVSSSAPDKVITVDQLSAASYRYKLTDSGVLKADLTISESSSAGVETTTSVDNLQNSTRSIETSYSPSGQKIRREQVVQSNGTTSSKLRDVILKLELINGVWKLLEQTIDPDGEYLFTKWTYNSYGELQHVIYPDGYWEKYEYRVQGISKVWSPFKDAPSHPDLATDTNCRLVTYGYGSSTLGATTVTAQTDVTTEIFGQTVMNKHADYAHLTVDGVNVEEQTTTTTPAGSPAMVEKKQRLVFAGDSRLTGRLHSETDVEGRVYRYTYQRGIFAPITATFTPSATGNFLKVVQTQGTTGSPEGVDLRTKRKTFIEDGSGRIVLEDEEIRVSASNFELLNRYEYDYDDAGHTLASKKDGRIFYSATYENGLVKTETDECGTKREYFYDFRDRLVRMETAGIAAFTDGSLTLPAIPTIKISYGYDGLDRKVNEVRGEAALTVGRYTRYSVAGNIVSAEKENGLISSTVYSNGGRTSTTVLPTGSTEIVDRYSDRETRSKTGSGVVPEFSDYGVWSPSDAGRTGGTIWARRTLGAMNSNRTTLKTSDGYGRLLREEWPEKNGQVFATNHRYNARGLKDRISVEPAGGPGNRYFFYDSLGNPSKQGLDMDNSNSIVDQSPDQILEFEAFYEKQGSDWWLVEKEKEFFAVSDLTSTPVKTTRTKINGLPAGQVSEKTIVDVLGRKTVTREYIDRSHSLLKKMTDPATALYPPMDHIRNGLLQARGGSAISQKPTKYFHDALGRETSRIEPRGDLVVSTVYVQDSYNVASVDVGGVSTTVYDYYPVGSGVNSGKLMTENCDGLKTHYSWTATGKVYRQWGKEYPVEYGYDAFGALISMKTFRSQTTTNYDSWPSSSPSNTNETQWSYDPKMGYVVAKTDAATQSVNYTYDAWNRRSTREWARGVTTTYGYDANNAITSIAYGDATPGVVTTYNRRGLRSSVSDGSGVRAFTYTADRQLLTDTSGMGLWTNQRVYFPYEEGLQISQYRGGKLSMLNDSPKFHYWMDGRISYIDVGNYPSSSFTIGMSYDENVLIEMYDYTMGFANLELERDALGRLIHSSISSPFGDYSTTFSYNDSLLAGIVYNDGAYWQLSYNGRGEVKEGIFSLGNQTPVPPFEDYQYIYDNIGNRKESVVDGAITSYGTNALNQYDSVVTPGASVAPIHDADGNLVNDGKWQYVWDAENRLISMTSVTLDMAAKQLLFLYDADGRRIAKSVFSYNGSSFNTTGVVTWFAYDRNNVIAEYAVSGGVPVLAKRYHWGSDLADQPTGTIAGAAGGVGGLLAIEDVATGELFHPLYDQNGNVIEIVEKVSSMSEVVASYRYDPFGKRTRFSSTWPGFDVATNPFQFSTKYLDAETGLYNFGFRYYNPSTGRWLSRDPMEEAGGINLYGFVSNNPFKYIDPFGLEIRIYSDSTFGGAGGAQHTFAWSTETKSGVGRSGCSGSASSANGVPPGFDPATTNLPYSVYDISGSGKTEAEIMKEFKEHINDSWFFCPFLSDCHSALNSCAKRAGIPEQAGPLGRSSWDDWLRGLRWMPFRFMPVQ